MTLVATAESVIPSRFSDGRIMRVQRQGVVQRDGVARSRSAVQMECASSHASRHGGRLRLTRRGRAVVLVAAALCLLLVGFGRMGAQASGTHAPREVVVHTVVSGETVWAIAQSVTAQGADVRDTIVTIGELNGMSDSHIEPGETLILPKAS